MIRTGIIGMGDIAPIHIEALNKTQNVNIVATCDIDESKRGVLKEAAFYTDYKEMIEGEELDCVHICLPHHLHVPVSVYCIEKGLNIFMEKPLGIDIKDCNDILEAADKNRNLKIGICLQNRENETTEKLMEIVRSKNYGELKGIKGLVAWHRPKSYFDEKPWRGRIETSGGGVMINQGIHTLDIMQLVGGEIEWVKGSISNLLDFKVEVEDTAAANIKFKNGARGMFFSTNANIENSSIEIEVLFEKARFTIKGDKLYRTDGNAMDLMAENIKLSGSKFYYGASHKKLINKFYRAIEEDSDDYIKIEEGIDSMKLIEAIKRSSSENKEIKLEELT